MEYHSGVRDSIKVSQARIQRVSSKRDTRWILAWFTMGWQKDIKKKQALGQDKPHQKRDLKMLGTFASSSQPTAFISMDIYDPVPRRRKNPPNRSIESTITSMDKTKQKVLASNTGLQDWYIPKTSCSTIQTKTSSQKNYSISQSRSSSNPNQNGHVQGNS